MGPLRVAIFAAAVGILIGLAIANPYSWMRRDNFDKIMDRMIAVNEQNCKFMSMESLRLPADSIGQIPAFTKLPQIVIFRNRSNLIHVHNTALNRAFYYSYILQRLNTSEADFPMLPGFMYYYMSASADISSSPGMLNGSGILYDTNTFYANFFANLDFNKTLPLFGPKAWRLDDFDDNVNWLREPTNNTIKVMDLGAGRDSNYTAPWNKLYQMFIRDTSRGIDFIPDSSKTRLERKHMYDTELIRAKRTGEMENSPNAADIRKFFGPPSPGIDEDYQPVYFSRPYFDCGRSNIWLVTAVAPVIDFMSRYSAWINLRKPQYVGVATADIDFLRIDFDPCARSSRTTNVDKTYFSGIARCRPTTICEPITGYGFKRGGYMCHCKPGYRYPYWQNGPFMGRDLEQASASEADKFECIPVNWKMQRLSSDGIRPAPGSPPILYYSDDAASGANNDKRRKRSVSETQELIHLLRLYNTTSIAELHKKVAEADRLDREAAAAAKAGSWAQRLKSNIGAAAAKIKNALLNKQKQQQKQQEQQEQEQLKRRKRAISTPADFGDQNVFYLGRKSTFDANRFQAVQSLMALKRTVTKANCRTMPAESLVLPGEVGFGAQEQFEVQARAALRLSHFLSAFMQNVNPDELYGNLQGDGYLNQHHLYGEVFANVMSDKWILSSGIYFDREFFWDPEQKRKLEYFGPTALKPDSNQETQTGQRKVSFLAEDAAGWSGRRAYYTQDWFRVLKERWGPNTYGLERFVNKPFVRTDINGSQVRMHMRFPLHYSAPAYKDMFWSKPYFDCKFDANSTERPIQDWIITTSVPFFGMSQHKTLQFAGVVAVSVPLSKLDVSMCPGSFYEANYFKNAAPCDYESTFCVPITRNKFDQYGDSFKCECRQGYEYPFNDISVWFFAGGTVTDHYNKMLAKRTNYYRILKCREASGNSITATAAATIAAAALAALAGLWN